MNIFQKIIKTGVSGKGLLSTGIVFLAVFLGVAAAWRRSWTSDDAFISFRYAENLVNGHGLVFNVGERVEGYTNFLWTLWCALGIELGADVEMWAIAWGLVFYAGCILLLGFSARSLKDSNSGFLFPIGAALAAVHAEWHVYATGGLETSMFTFLAFGGYRLTVRQRYLAAGIVLALATLTRPDGVLFMLLCGVFVLIKERTSIRHILRFGLPCVVILVPFMLWRYSYYGDWFPNTYYAKSANLSWYSQGWLYMRLYYSKYWLLLSGLPLIALMGWLFRNTPDGADYAGKNSLAYHAALAAACALVYTFYIIKVGGGFMYGRLLVPTAPFLLILIDYGLVKINHNWTLVHSLIGTTLFTILLLIPSPSELNGKANGIVDEWAYYSWARQKKIESNGRILKNWFSGLPVRIAFVGSGARLVYYTEVPVAVESETGLTDHFIARQKLVSRRRIGHEKHGTPQYLIKQRGLHFVFHPKADAILKLHHAIPIVPINVGGVQGLILHWDPKILDPLKQRGAIFPDFPRYLDEFIIHADKMSQNEMRTEYEKFKLFYFDHVKDPERERFFLQRIANGSGAKPST